MSTASSAIPDKRKRIWSLVKPYRHVEGGRHKFAKFLFIPHKNLSDEFLEKISDVDKRILEDASMMDKEEVFNVVYDRTEKEIGGPLSVQDIGPYLLFTKRD